MRSAGLSLIVLLAFASSVIASDQRPNILLILADDLGYSDLGCYGGEIATPTLDRLAAEGLRFRRFYNSGKCEPTRASLLSGQYWQSVGLGIKRGPTMGHVLQKAGYATFAVGKWHLQGNPVERGFDRYFGHLSGATDYFRGNDSYRLDDQSYVPQAGFYSTDANADYAIKYLEESCSSDPDKPFFCYLAFNAPHSPLHALPEDIQRYHGKFDRGWDDLRKARHRRQIELGVVDANWPLLTRPETIPAWDSLSAEEQSFETRRMEVYAAMVDRMDQAIGRVLTRVAELGKSGNTLVLFLSDNGASPYDRLPRDKPSPSKTTHNIGLGWAHLSGTPFRHYKRNVFNGGSCSPLIVHWPNGLEPRGEITDQAGHIIDVMATVLDVGKGTWPTEFDGKAVGDLPGQSLTPIFAGKTHTPHHALYFHLMDHRAIIVDEWKLASDWGRPWQLFNLQTDRCEVQDLTSQHPKRAAQLARRWEQWATEYRVRLKPAGREPIYRSQSEEKQRFVGK